MNRFRGNNASRIIMLQAGNYEEGEVIGFTGKTAEAVHSGTTALCGMCATRFELKEATQVELQFGWVRLRNDPESPVGETDLDTAQVYLLNGFTVTMNAERGVIGLRWPASEIVSEMDPETKETIEWVTVYVGPSPLPT